MHVIARLVSKLRELREKESASDIELHTGPTLIFPLLIHGIESRPRLNLIPTREGL